MFQQQASTPVSPLRRRMLDDMAIVLSGRCRVSQPDPSQRHGGHPGGGGLHYVRSFARRPEFQIPTTSVDATSDPDFVLSDGSL